MSNRQIIILVALAMLLLGGSLVYYYRNQSPRFDWDDSWNKKAYQETNTEPYGTQVMHRLLDDYFPEHQLKDLVKNIATELPQDSTPSTSATYVFVGEAMYLDSISTARLLDFVKAGKYRPDFEQDDPLRPDVPPVLRRMQRKRLG
ncbi:MAG: hypothetical protein IPL27_22235 [Lewinellaceae bacterium]|nr:hypothetical protein [Lewinellaceae bacterium]